MLNFESSPEDFAQGLVTDLNLTEPRMAPLIAWRLRYEARDPTIAQGTRPHLPRPPPLPARSSSDFVSGTRRARLRAHPA